MPELRHLNALDYTVVAVYMVAVIVVGVFMSRFNKQTSDYFKGGGSIPWGLSALSLFVSGFSAFMFVGAAGYTYRNGGAAIVLFTSAFFAYLLGYAIYGPLWRRSRIDTPMQFLNRRFSPGTTYFYTLLSVVPNVLILGINIYTLCIFVSTALGFGSDVFLIGSFEVNGFQLTLIATGLVIVFYTMLGGLWAVIVTDALQFFVLFLATIIILPVAYFVLGDGNPFEGIRRVAQETPSAYFGLAVEGQSPLFWVAYMINIVLGYNVNWHIAQRYYSVPDERDTRKMALWCAGLSLVLPLMWIIPVMASRVLFPDMASLWPELTEPSEAAFVTLAMATLPNGMLGVMVAAMFAATMSSADTTFNWLAAVLTKDVYVPVSQRVRGAEPSEQSQLRVGKISVAALGVIAIWVALSMAQYGGAFDVYLKVNSLYSAPMFIPVLFGLVYTRTPWWSGMVAFGVGVLAVVVAGIWANLALGLPFASLGDLFADIKLQVLGLEMGRYELNTLVGTLASTLCFFCSALAFQKDGRYQDRIARLVADLRTPAFAADLRLNLRGLEAYRLAGWLSLGIGGMLLIMALPFLPSGSPLLNLAGGLLAVLLGVSVIYGARWYEVKLMAALATSVVADNEPAGEVEEATGLRR